MKDSFFFPCFECSIWKTSLLPKGTSGCIFNSDSQHFLFICPGGDFNYYSKTGRLRNIKHKELVEIRCLVSVFAEGCPNLSIVYRSYKDFWNTNRNGMGWSCT